MNKRIIILFATIIALIALMGATSPNTARLPLYLVVFSLIYIISMLVIQLFLDIAYSSLTRSEKLFISIVFAFCPAVIMALGSLSSVSFIDIVLAIGVPAIIVWYGLRRGVIK
ncbi:MAG: hypothetical protein U0491_00090 [Candidatus Saccharimonadales bacterium]